METTHSSLKRIRFDWLLALLILLASCRPLVPEDAPATSTMPVPTATATPTATASPRPSSTPAPTSTPSMTPTPAPLSPAEIFDLVAPSIVYVEAPNKSGSGIFVDDGYVVTNAHVVWPYTTVRVVAASGHEYDDVRVVAWDLMADLAVLGPLDGLVATPLQLTDGEALVVGADVYLIGYPGEVNRVPAPTITRGLISQVREWNEVGITFFQSDATIAGGQSGGALVSEIGEVIGVSGFVFGERQFALVASAIDILPRVTALIEGKDPSGMGSRRLNLNDGKNSQLVSLPEWEVKAFLLLNEAGKRIEITVNSKQDVAFDVLDMDGYEVVMVDDGFEGDEWTTFEASYAGPYFVRVVQGSSRFGSATITSGVPLIPLVDADDNSRLKRGETVFGALDFPGDIDYYWISAGRNEVVDLQVDSVSFDPYLWVSYDGAGLEQIVGDDDGGDGLFGTNARLLYQAPHAGSFLVGVEDAYGQGVGGYALSALREQAAGPTPISPPPTPRPVDSPFGPLVTYGDDSPYTMQVPALWRDTSAAMLDCIGTCYESDDGEAFLMIMAEATEKGVAMTREQLAEYLFDAMEASYPGSSRRSRQTLTTESGLLIEFAEYVFPSSMGNAYLNLALAYEEGITFLVIYVLPDANYADLKGMVDYTFRSIALR